MRRSFLCIQLVLLLFLFSSCGPWDASSKQPLSESSFMLDTVITLSLYDSADESVLQEAFDEIHRLETILSVDYEGSEVEKLWKNAGSSWMSVSPETLELLKKSIAYSELSEGYFDVTAGPLISLWNIRDGKGHYPKEQEALQAKSLINYKDILFRADADNEVMLVKAGMKVNFGAIAKGYIADRVKDLLLSKGVKSAIINLGGNVLLIGGPPEGGDFRIGVQDPFGGTGEIIGVLELRDKSLVSSGVYERNFEYNGKKYHHILDPFTGYPAENSLAGVTVITEESVDGDALSTTVFLLGKEKGMALLEKLENTEGIFIEKNGSISVTKGLEGKFIEKK